MVRHHDQPFADSSAIPTYLVSKLTREQVTVALTGDGGDELFAGYERFYAADLMRKLQFMPAPILRGAAGLLQRLPEGTGYYDPIKRARRFARAASQPLEDAYFDLVRVVDIDLLAALCPGAALHSPKLNASPSAAQPHPIAALAEANMRSYLPDDLLIKADRCSMAASLEARAPFLDHELAEFAAAIPFNLKLKGSRTKHILKEAARGLLPPEIIDRKKHGFGVPLGAWLRRDMTPMRELLLSRRARERGLLEIVSGRALNRRARSGRARSQSAALGPAHAGGMAPSRFWRSPRISFISSRSSCVSARNSLRSNSVCWSNLLLIVSKSFAFNCKTSSFVASESSLPSRCMRLS